MSPRRRSALAAALFACAALFTSARPVAADDATPSSMNLAPSHLSDGERVKLPPMVVAQDRAAVDRRPMYVGAGLVAMAALFWWNRQRRDRFEREDRGASSTADARRRDRRRDADADDLHAAARGDHHEP